MRIIGGHRDPSADKRAAEDRPNKKSRLYEYSSGDTQAILKRHREFEGERERKSPADYGGPGEFLHAVYLMQPQRYLIYYDFQEVQNPSRKMKEKSATNLTKSRKPTTTRREEWHGFPTRYYPSQASRG